MTLAQRSLRIVAAEEIARALDYESMIEALADAFCGTMTAPTRHHHTISRPGRDATLLLMPAWTLSGERFVGCKIASIFPDNAAFGKPSLHGGFLLLSGDTGEPLALMDAGPLTAFRTAAASALASRHLARRDASHLVMVGAGALAPHLVRAHACVRPIRRVTVWNRSPRRAEELARRLRQARFVVEAIDDLASAVREADIVSCATLSTEPLVQGAWLKPGAHLDLVGGFTPMMRETDDEALRRARVYVDTRAGALAEAGDLVDPIRRGVISEADVQGDLVDLCHGRDTGRRSDGEITLFKSVGASIEDLAAAILVWERLCAPSAAQDKPDRTR